MASRIICEIDFLRKYDEDYRCLKPSDRDKMSNWWNLFDSIWSDALTSFSLDCSQDEFNRFLDHTIRPGGDNLLLKLWKANQSKFRFNATSITTDTKGKNMSDAELCSSYLVVDDDNVTKRTRGEACGILVINSEEYLANSNLYKQQGRAIRQDEIISWKEIFHDLPPQNCLVIYDLYIAKNQERLNNNLYPILDILLPAQLDIPFQLAIFTSEPECINFDRLYDLIVEHLKKTKKRLKIVLSIFECKNHDFHDRGIIGNNLTIQATGGLDLIERNKSTKTAEIRCFYPVFDKSELDKVSARNHLNDARKSARDYLLHGANQSHRLLK